MLTTHYNSLCTMMDNNKNIINKQMECINSKSGGHNYTYKLIDGISNIKGGIKVLEELKYSEEILFSAKEVIKNNI